MDDIDYGVAYIKHNSGNRIKVTMNTFREITYIHIREYVLDGDTNKLYPTKSGYAILAEELDSVIELLEQASKSLGADFKKSKQLSLNV